MTYRMFLDDERSPPADGQDWEIARDFVWVKYLVKSMGMPVFISFDHDLGDDQPTGLDIAKWLIARVLDGHDTLPEGFAYTVHSQNPVGKANIEGLMDGFLRHLAETARPAEEAPGGAA